MSDQTASAVQRAPTPSAAVKVGEPQALVDRITQTYQAIAQRAFALFESEGGPQGRDVEHWLKAEAELLHSVPVSITETDDALAVQAEVPGFTAAEL